jgi:hypothetical protein
VRAARLNQDALRWWPRSGAGSTLVLANSDGHGGARYVRSQIGAQLAVRTAVQVLSRDLLALSRSDTTKTENKLDLIQLKRTCEEWLPKVLVRRWQERVERHLRRYPLSHDERALVVHETHPVPAHTPKQSRGIRAYGATLLAVLITDTFHLYVQLGDGDILTVNAEGRVTRPPLPVDERLIGNETTSLCTPEAWRTVKLYFQPLINPPPSLILLATDGYANSFVDGDAFEQVGADLLEALRSQGVDEISSDLPEWLWHTSISGSGDDITVALALHQGKYP